MITAVVDPDGRTGFGIIHEGHPPSTILFSFAEGRSMHLTQTIPAEPDGTLTAIEESFVTGSHHLGRCQVAYAWSS